ncbi:iron-sulfur cluster assembly protein [Rhodococcus sp. IEGM 1354]|uniref:iron-sulfur cluster assembly protein n=1 Tax=Rhodococcus sp. IEGM 1354 TaxID=3047088 RepID=UPI0024B678B8|nr:iron-sulfur cluster assembly protein [Rhodococcus sp. IEGM 1354]MDI9932648.1 iron-sulfur cluster assembly protein [Rhodococcus sp. IEGM 1354]
MTTAVTTRKDEAYRALDVVLDPELDEPITDLGFVRSLEVDEGTVHVHLRLPTSFCSPNFAYLMAGDSKDVLTALPWTEHVLVELDDHHDSDKINAGLAADAGYRGTFGHEAEEDLDELRATFRRKAYVAAMERSLNAWLKANPEASELDLAVVTLGDLPDNRTTTALLRRRESLGLRTDTAAPALVDHAGRPHAGDLTMVMRRARATRVSIDGNAHFCRGLLQTRYPGAEEQQVPRSEGAFIPLTTFTTQEHSS